MRKKTLIAAGGALVVTLALAGCAGGNSMGGMPGMGGAPAGGSQPSARPSNATFNDADVAFAMNMIVHHQQAIQMSNAVLSKTGVDPAVTDLATKIKAAQAPEITQMRKLLTSWGQSTGASGMAGMAMNGMMTGAELNALENATGAEASTLFLNQMIKHHQGAIDMAQQQVKDGKNTEAIALAKKIVTDQTAEIATIKSLLAR